MNPFRFLNLIFFDVRSGLSAHTGRKMMFSTPARGSKDAECVVNANALAPFRPASCAMSSLLPKLRQLPVRQVFTRILSSLTSFPDSFFGNVLWG